jgi:hypothetical protein
MLDPPRDDDRDEHSKKAERVNPREWRIHDDARFSQSTRFLSQAKMLAFAGDDELATAKVEAAEFRVPRRRRVQRVLETTENELGRFRGFRQALGFGDRMRVDIFQGIETDVYESLRVNDPARTHDQTTTFWHRIEQLGRPDLKQPVVASRGDGSLTVKTVGPDGSMLELRIAAR